MSASILLSKIVSLGFAAPRRYPPVSQNETSEQRREIRRASNNRLFMQVVRSDDEDLVGRTVSCRAIDVSANGLRVTCSHDLPTGCELDLWVDDSSRPGKYFLASEVRWCTREEDGYQIGIELLQGAATDIQAWQQRQA